MQSKLGHIYLYVSDLDKSFEFYKKFLEYLDYKEGFRADWGGSLIKDGTSIWLEQTPKDHSDVKYHRRRTGLNHLAFRVTSKENVDAFYEDFLKKNGIDTLYNTPKHFPEYEESYYAVFFEDPDGIKLEVAYYD
jgi:catechol 2,3-dioxygenase-like lactoylglutathione lyase family enzyme